MELSPMPVPPDADEEMANYIYFVLGTFASFYAGVVAMIDVVGLARAEGLLTSWSANSTSSHANVVSEASLNTMHESVISGIPLAILICIVLLPPDSIPSALFGRISAESNEETFDTNHASRVSALCLLECSFAFVLNMIVIVKASKSLEGKALIYLCVGVLQAVFVLLSFFCFFTSFFTHRGVLRPRRIRKYESIRSPEYVRETTRMWKCVNCSVWSTLSMLCLLIIDAIFGINDGWRPYFVLIFTLLSSYAVLLNLYVISDYSTLTFVKVLEDDDLPGSSRESDRMGGIPSAKPVKDKGVRWKDELGASPQRNARSASEHQIQSSSSNENPVPLSSKHLAPSMTVSPAGPNESRQTFVSLKGPYAHFISAENRNASGSSGETRTLSGSSTPDEGISLDKARDPRTLKQVEMGATHRNQNDRSSAFKRDSVGPNSVVDHGLKKKDFSDGSGAADLGKDNHKHLENVKKILKSIDRFPRGEQTLGTLKMIAAISALNFAQAEEQFVAISAQTERWLAALSDQMTAQTEQGHAALSAQVTALSEQVTAQTEQGLAEKDRQFAALSAQVAALSEQVTALSGTFPEQQDPSTKESEGVEAPHGSKDLSIQDQENPNQTRPESSAGRHQRSPSPSASIFRKAKGFLRKFTP